MLISYLSARVFTLPFDGLSKLLKDTDYKIAVMPGSYSEDAFKESKDPLWQIAWVERIQPYLEYYKKYTGK